MTREATPQEIAEHETLQKKALLADTLTECVKDQGRECTCYACLLEFYGNADAKVQQLVSYVLTVRSQNTPEWMEGLADRINHWAEATGEEDRVATTSRGRALQVITPQDRHETRPDTA